MATPLVVKQVLEPVPAKRVSKSQRSSVPTSITERNRDNAPKFEKGSKIKLEVKGNRIKDSGPVKMPRLNYASTRQEMPLTFTGFPKNKYRGKYSPNTVQ